MQQGREHEIKRTKTVREWEMKQWEKKRREKRRNSPRTESIGNKPIATCMEVRVQISARFVLTLETRRGGRRKREKRIKYTLRNAKNVRTSVFFGRRRAFRAPTTQLDRRSFVALCRGVLALSTKIKDTVACCFI